jgi:hypothetical protein
MIDKIASKIRSDGRAHSALLPSLAVGVGGIEFITAAIASRRADGNG